MHKLAINGFGRIGRLTFRAFLEKELYKHVQISVVNDIVDASNLVYLLKYDSTHGKLKDFDVELREDVMLIKKHNEVISETRFLNLKKNPADLPWGDYNIDLIIESTGVFRKKQDANGHLEAGAKKVLITAPSDDEVPHFLVGVNSEKYGGENLISNASCTTNAIAPMVRVLMQSDIGIKQAIASTVHAYTASQALQDMPSKKDFRRGRSAAENIIPTTTGAAKAVCFALPELEGKITASAYRVPVKNGSLIDLNVMTEQDTSLEEINHKFKEASVGNMQGVLEYSEDPLVSSDIIGNPHSLIYDANASLELNSKFFKLVGWYDNEWGYSNRVIEMAIEVLGND